MPDLLELKIEDIEAREILASLWQEFAYNVDEMITDPEYVKIAQEIEKLHRENQQKKSAATKNSVKDFIRAEKVQSTTQDVDHYVSFVRTLLDIMVRGPGEVSVTPKLFVNGIVGSTVGTSIGYAEGLMSLAVVTHLVLRHSDSYQQAHNYAAIAAYAFSGAQSIVFSYTPWMATICQSLNHLSSVSPTTVLVAPAATLAVAIDIAVSAKELFIADKKCKFKGWLEEQVKEWNFIQNQLLKEKERLDKFMLEASENDDAFLEVQDKVKYFEARSAVLINQIHARSWANKNPENEAYIKLQMEKMDNLDAISPEYLSREAARDFVVFRDYFKNHVPIPNLSMINMERYTEVDREIQGEVEVKRKALSLALAAKTLSFIGCVLMSIAPFTGPAAPVIFAVGVAITTTLLLLRLINFMRVKKNRELIVKKITRFIQAKTVSETLHQHIDIELRKFEGLARTKKQEKIKQAKGNLFDAIHGSLGKYATHLIHAGLDHGMIRKDRMDANDFEVWLKKYPDLIDADMEEKLKSAIRASYITLPREGGNLADNLIQLQAAVKNHNAKVLAHAKFLQQVTNKLASPVSNNISLLKQAGTTTQDAKAFIFANLDDLTKVNLEAVVKARQQAFKGRGEATTLMLSQYAKFVDILKMPDQEISKSDKIKQILQEELRGMPAIQRQDSKTLLQTLYADPPQHEADFVKKISQILGQKKINIADLHVQTTHLLDFIYKAILSGQDDLIPKVIADMKLADQPPVAEYLPHPHSP